MFSLLENKTEQNKTQEMYDSKGEKGKKKTLMCSTKYQKYIYIVKKDLKK